MIMFSILRTCTRTLIRTEKQHKIFSNHTIQSRTFFAKYFKALTGKMATPIVEQKDDRLVWVDLEMTGLDESKEEIMEVAAIITDGDLAVVEKGPNMVLQVPSAVLDNMGEWCAKQHGKTGLTAKCRESKVSLKDAEKALMAFLERHCTQGSGILSGNSIGTDKRFLAKYMPAFTDYLHYRIVDVSTVKELCRRWYPEEFKAAPKKNLDHRALEDIEDSIAELQYYRTAVFKAQSSANGKAADAKDEAMYEPPHKKAKKDDRLVWIDLEMTGLDPATQHIMEVAVVVTDGQLNVVARGPDLVLQVPASALDAMDEWCTTQHGKTGLTEACRKSEVSLADAEQKVLQFVEEHTDKGTGILAGNCIGTDKLFLSKYMPAVIAHLHYRVVDVSAVKELCQRWFPSEVTGAPAKTGDHRAMADILESVEELRFLRRACFKARS